MRDSLHLSYVLQTTSIGSILYMAPRRARCEDWTVELQAAMTACAPVDKNGARTPVLATHVIFDMRSA